MWLSVGLPEVALVILVAAVLLLLGKRGRRWISGIVPSFALAAMITPTNDAVTMLIIAIPLSLAFVSGVFLSSYVRATNVRHRAS